MPDNKTIPTGASVADFLASVEPEKRRRGAYELRELMSEATGLEPRMWGPSIVGFGRYAYRYESGHSGEMCLTGFSPRKSALTIYILPGFELYADQLSRLGKHKNSVSCLYVTSLDKIDRKALTEIIRDSVERMKAKYPDWQPE